MSLTAARRCIVAAANCFTEAHLQRKGALLEPAKPADSAAIGAAEQRIGFPLPVDFASLLRSVGALSVGEDGGFHSIDQLDNAYVQMRNVWGTPEAAMQEEHSTSFRTLLRNSVLLYTQTGDGPADCYTVQVRTPRAAALVRTTGRRKKAARMC